MYEAKAIWKSFNFDFLILYDEQEDIAMKKAIAYFNGKYGWLLDSVEIYPLQQEDIEKNKLFKRTNKKEIFNFCKRYINNVIDIPKNLSISEIKMCKNRIKICNITKRIKYCIYFTTCPPKGIWITKIEINGKRYSYTKNYDCPNCKNTTIRNDYPQRSIVECVVCGNQFSSLVCEYDDIIIGEKYL